MYRHFPSLNERVVKSRMPVQPWSKEPIPTRSGPRKLWSDENMQRAVAAVEKQGESLRHASEKYGVPRCMTTSQGRWSMDLNQVGVLTCHQPKKRRLLAFSSNVRALDTLTLVSK